MTKEKRAIVDYVGIGVEKAGTTWMAKCLAEHPEICHHPSKGLYFFNDVDSHFLEPRNTKYSRGIKWYTSQFENCDQDRLRGEWSTTYLYTKKTAERIHKYLPNAKIIVSLRNPIERAYSQYLYELRLGFIKDQTFEEVLVNRPDIIEKGYYAKYLEYYYNLFPKKNIHVIIYEDAKKNPDKTIKDLYKFIGVTDSNYKPQSLHKTINAAGAAFVPSLNNAMIKFEYFMRSHGGDVLLLMIEKVGVRNLAMKVRDLNVKDLNDYPKLTITTEKLLIGTYKKDIKQLEILINKKVSWLKN